ncbi:MAG TPA: carboxypeptidase regulatory-like domain-containing protein [Bryobacteraceae bacterium]
MSAITWREFTSAAVLLLALSCGLRAQSTPQIQGLIRDASGAAVSGAIVKASQTEMGTARTTTSDVDGAYVLSNLAIGPYRLEVTKPGFKTYIQTGVVVQVESQSTVDIALRVGDLNEQVKVVADAALVETQSTNIGSVIENRRILELPLNGRLATDLIQLAGWAIPQGVAGSGGFPNTGQIVIAGGQAFGSGFYLDGGQFNNPWDNANLPFPFPDALQEFKVETNALDAGKGVHAGASINAATKSGTNDLHGDLFEFLRNNVLNAQNFFTNASPNAVKDSLKRNQFGGAFGGPIIRDRWFLFAAYQNTQTRLSAPAPDAFVPTAAMQAGDFSACPSAIPASLASDFDNGKLAPGISFDPVSLKLARALPATSDPCGRTHFVIPTQVGEHQVVARTDYQINKNQSLFGRYLLVSYYRPPAFALAPANILTTQQAGLDDLVQSVIVGHTWTAGPNAVNSFRGGMNRVAVGRGNADFFSGCDLGVKMYCGYLPHQSFFSVTDGSFALGTATGSKARSISNSYQLGDDFSQVKGAHQIGFGVTLSQYRLSVRSTVYAQDQYMFPSLVAFLLGGTPSNSVMVTTSLPLSMGQEKWYFGSYVRDTWKLSPRLTLNAGLRYEPFLPMSMVEGAVYDFNLTDMIAGKKTTMYRNAPPGLTFPGDPDFPGHSGMNRQWNLFAPRVGVAWDPTGQGRLSIRAAYGLAYEFNNGQLFVNSANSPPFGGTVAFSASSFSDPFAGNPGANIFPYTVGPNAPFVQGGVFIPLRPDMHTTAVHQWDLATQRQFGSNWLASITYAGSQTEHLWLDYQLNPAIIVPCPESAPITTCNNTLNTNARRIFTLNQYSGASLISNMDQLDDGGTASYNSLTLAVEKRLSQGVSANANYTWSHCIGDLTDGNSVGSGQGGLAEPANRRQDRSNCVSREVNGDFSSDRRHLFNFTVVAETPRFANRKMRTLATGWQAAGIYRAQSAAWLTVAMSPPDRQLSGINGQRPLQVLPDTLCANPTSSCWLNPAAFAVPAPGTLSTMNRANVPGPGFWQLDMSVARTFQITERQKLQVRAESFNLTNSFRAGIAPPNLTAGSPGISLALGSPNFGRITSALEPRLLQLAMKYVF